MSLNAFLNPIKEENRKIVVSKRFIGEDGKPKEWEIKAMTAEENEALKKACTSKVPVKGKYGQFTTDFDERKYMISTIAKCVVYPNLNNAELQNAHSAMGAEMLLQRMLKPGELAILSDAVAELNGFGETFDELVEEAKN